MNPDPALPIALTERLTALGRRLRAQRIVGAIARFSIVVVLSASLFILIDLLVTLSPLARGSLLVSWLILLAFTGIRLGRRCLIRTDDPVALAALIESEYPRLGERLTTVVELAGHTDSAGGSPAFLELLIRDAETRTSRLDLRRAAPATATLVLGGVGIVVLLLAVTSLVTVPDAAAQARRFFTPWHRPTVDVPYFVKVTSGSPTIKAGDMTALTALVEPTRPDAPLPTIGTVLIRDNAGTRSLVMNSERDKRELYLTLGPLETDFDYQVRAGDAASDWHHVTVIDPVRLESARVLVEPPAYARRPGDMPAPADGLADLSVLQHGQIIIEPTFSRMPTSAWFEWKPEAGKSVRINVPVSGAAVTVPATASGTLSLHAEVDKLKSRFRDMHLRVAIDQPPRIERVAGLTSQLRRMRPDEKPTIDITAGDDVGISKVQLELRVNREPIRFVDVPVRGLGTTKANGRYTLDLTGIAKQGDDIAMRLAVTDNRDVPEANLKPQTTWFPAENQWSELKLDAQAAPLKEQEIASQKAEIDERLKAIRARLNTEAKVAQAMKAESVLRPVLRFEQIDRLDELRGDVQDTAELMDELARDIARVAELSSLGQAISETAQADVRPASASLKQAARDTAQQPRTGNLESAQAGLREAERKLAQLLKLNEQLARQRLDTQKLDDLAEQQRDLSERVAKADEAERAVLQQKQKELDEKLRQLQQDSEPLREALRAMQQKQFDKSVDTARQTEQDVRDLTQAMKNTEQRTHEERHAALLRRQQDLVTQAEDLARRTSSVARTAQLPPLKQDEIQKAFDTLKNGQPGDAVEQQEKAAFELDRLAQALEGAIARMSDPREAARQLARLQDDLRQNITAAVKDTPFDQLPRERRDAFEKQQQAIRNAARRLTVPQPNEATRQGVIDSADGAADRLMKSDAAGADEQMRKTGEALKQLAEQLPTQEKRLAAARGDLAKLRSEQDAIATLVEQSARLLERHDPDAAATRQELVRRTAEVLKRQAQTADKLAKLDLPGHQPRQMRAADALERAKQDLESGRVGDVGASQQAARRELERLEQAIAGQTPADEQADRLAKRQKDLAAQLRRNVQQPDDKKTRELKQLQQELTGDLQKLAAPEAPATRDDALALTRKTGNASKPADAADSAEQAAEALQRLADHVNGRDSEADKADRLAKKQRQQADDADRLAEKKDTSGDLRRRTQQLQDEARHLRPGNDGQKEKQQAIDALTRAQQAKDPIQQAQAQNDAAGALQRLADKLREQPPPVRPMAKADDEGPDGVPKRQQADEARRLAETQRKLRDELARSNEQLGKEGPLPKDNPLAKLVEEQEKIASDAGDLAKVAGNKGEGPALQQAEGAAKQAAGRLKVGQIDAARDAGQQTAQQLEQVAQGKADADRRQAARDLAKRQEAINRKLGELAGNDQAARRQQMDRQQQLQQQIDDFKQQLREMSQQMKKDNSAASGKAEEGAMHAGQSAEAMKQAREQAMRNERDAARKTQDKSADELKQAADKLRDAANAMPKDPMSDKANMPAGQSLDDAHEQMTQASRELDRNQPKQASDAMQQAARALSQAARQIGQPPKNGTPGANGQSANDGSARNPTDPRLPPDIEAKFAGKRWGDLPGDIRQQIINDMKARYGEEYAQYIKLYFEQLAERR